MIRKLKGGGIRETYGDWTADYSPGFLEKICEEWTHLKLEPLAGCGPYLMTEEMMKPEKETKMSGCDRSNWGVMGALANQIVEDANSREEWRQLSGVSNHTISHANTVTFDIFSDSAMTVSVTEALAAAEARIRELEERLSAATDESTNHDYYGPVGSDGKSVPDPVHENFHKAVGDVLAGKVMNSARRQMQDALNRPTKDAPTTATTSRPMPGKAVQMPFLEKGVRL